ncbi:MAG: hypothetical protein V4687_14990 [Bacteroidota bacterium]
MKILSVLEAILKNPQFITNILQGEKEYYFLYKNSYKWSVAKGDDGIYYVHLYYLDYPSLAELATFTDWQNYNYKTWNTGLDQYDDNLFVQLYNLLAEKESGINDIFNDILSDL